MTQHAARFVSIAGHPAVLVPAAAVVASADGGRAIAVPAVSLAIGAALAVLAYSHYKTRRGDWSHVDASAAHERAQFNSRAGVALAAAAAVLAGLGIHGAIVAAVALSGFIVLAAHLLRRGAKPSLHVAFAVFAALLAWPHHLAVSLLLPAAVAVGWSRIALRRHTGGDLAWGAGIGALAGLVLLALRMAGGR